MAIKNISKASLVSILTSNPSDLVKDHSEVYNPNQLTGRQRLLRMIQIDEFGETSTELRTIIQVSCMSMFVGALYGGTLTSRVAYLDFFKNNQATIFKDHLEAKKRLQDKVTLAFGKGAFRWGWRLSLFSTSYVGISTGVSVYRGKAGILEHIVAGGVTGLLYKFNLGPRGWVIGSGLGMLLGVVAGGSTLGLLKLTGVSMEEVRGWNAHLYELRTLKNVEGAKKYMESEDLEILTERNKTMSNVKPTLDGIDSSEQ